MNPTDTPAINGWNDLMQLHSQNSLECLPDGSVISWERLLGDDTSRAIAFTRTEYGEDGQPVFWISPGGWQPMAPGDAGVTYPVTVLWIGSPADHLAPMPSATRPSEYELRRDAMEPSPLSRARMLSLRLGWNDVLRMYYKYIGVLGSPAAEYRFEAVWHGRAVRTVVREPDPADRRKTLVRVTPKGYELCHQCEQALRDYFASVLARLEPEQVAQMDALRGALMDAILAENAARNIDPKGETNHDKDL